MRMFHSVPPVPCGKMERFAGLQSFSIEFNPKPQAPMHTLVSVNNKSSPYISTQNPNPYPHFP
ncbi:MAG: hypothetical protein JWR09_2822 [Mucilaginibacter sp.]|nr:hypothetical protein [Mucilaginibacter sp.]